MSKAPPKVSRELANASRDDWMRSVQDQAKHRAVRQMEGYDTFKNMVSVAHLRPYHAENLREHGGPAPPAFSFGADGARAGPPPTPGASFGSGNGLGAGASGSAALVPPADSIAFDKAWRRARKTNAARWRYLGVVEDFAATFATEVSGTVLSEIVAALAEGAPGSAGDDEAGAGPESTSASGPDPRWRGADASDASAVAARVAETMRELSRAGRFALAVRLLPKKTKALVRELVERLERSGGADASEADALLETFACADPRR